MYNIYPPKKGDVTQKDLTKFALCGGNQESCICKYVIQKKGGANPRILLAKWERTTSSSLNEIKLSGGGHL